MKERVRRLLYFPYDETYREQIETQIVAENYRSERILAYVLLALQFFMIIAFTIRPGGFFSSIRRFRYITSYGMLAIALIVLLIIHRRVKENWQLHTMICTAFGIILALWISIISYLDSLGSVSIIIYCSAVPMLAAFLPLEPYILIVILTFTCVLTNSLVLQTPYGQENMFSTLVNSSFIFIISIVYAIRMYRARINNVYNTLLIEQKNSQLREANEKLDILSMTDTLTALGNRRYLEESVRIPLEKYGHHMGTFSVLMLDIDHFKQYNDKYGHPQGDQCLQAVAGALAAVADSTPFQAIRYGGEEFVLIITGLSREEVVAKAEELRTAIAQTPIPQPDGSVTKTAVSIGVSFHEAFLPGLLDTAIEEADQALYQAKQSGRNRTVLYSDGENPESPASAR